jgi:hypothetical protein
MTAILAAWQSQQLLKIKIPAVVLARSDNVLTFYSPTEAISWAVEQGAFADSFAAEVAYEQLKAEMKPRHAKEMYINPDKEFSRD